MIDGVNTYADEMFEVIQDGAPRSTGAYSSGDFGAMVSGFAPILYNGTVVGVVGADLSITEILSGHQYIRHQHHDGHTRVLVPVYRGIQCAF